MRDIITLIKRIIRKTITKIEYFYYRCFYKKPSLPKEFKQRLLLVCAGEDLKAAAQSYRQLFSHNVTEKIKEADLICEHVFDLLGSGPTKLSKEGEGYQPIDWHSDFKAGYRWDPQIFYKGIKYGHVKGVDIKVPWELSRFQHLNTLGQGYALTDDKKYREEFVSQVTDWIETNPIGFGVNWACTMDVAIRAANWLVAKEFFEESALPKEFLEKFYVSIYEHGRFIRNHLEYSSELTMNHYIADLAGLFFIAVYYPFFKESASWEKFCVNELAREIQKQVYEDGCDFEASTSYHRLVLEMFFYCELLGKRAGVEFPQAFRDKVRKMFEFSLYCIKPNGKIPQIGDNDNGRHLIFAQRPVLEHKYLLSLAVIYYRDFSFKLREFEFEEEAFWVFGLKGKEIYGKLPFRHEQLASKAFPDAGWYIMRHNNDYCFIVCGPNGQNGRGGHAHNDKLSFELMLEGEDIIVDPGTYLYTADPEERNKFRGTSFHNTIQIEDIEQNDISRGLFRMEQGSACTALKLEEIGDEIVFEGEVRYLKHALKHKRKFILNKKTSTFNLFDDIENQLPGRFLSNLCLRHRNSHYDFNIVKGRLEEKEGFYSGGYGIKENIRSFRILVDNDFRSGNSLTILKRK